MPDMLVTIVGAVAMVLLPMLLLLLLLMFFFLVKVVVVLRLLLLLLVVLFSMLQTYRIAWRRTVVHRIYRVMLAR